MTEMNATQKVPETHKSILLWNVLGVISGLLTALAIGVVGLFAGAAGVAGDANTAAEGRNLFKILIAVAASYTLAVLVSTVISHVRLSRRWAAWPLYVVIAGIALHILYFILTILYQVASPLFS